MTSSAPDTPMTAKTVAGTIVGNELRMARERLGWALADVAQRLRIRQVFLLAIEEGRFAALPGHAYALGFVRSYATLLGLSADEVAKRYRAEAHHCAEPPTLEFPAPVPDRGVPAGAVVLLGCLLSIAAYVGWYRASGEQPSTAIVETVPDRLAPLAMLPPPPSPPPAPVREIPPPPPPMGLPSYPPTSAGAAMPPPSFSMPPAPASELGVTTANDDAKIVIRARADTWVQIRDKAGQTLLNRVLRPGETYNVPPKQQLLFTTGNAGGVDLVIDGVTAPSLGGNGVVRRDLPLDPDAIRNVKAPPVRP